MNISFKIQFSNKYCSKNSPHKLMTTKSPHRVDAQSGVATIRKQKKDI